LRDELLSVCVCTTPSAHKLYSPVKLASSLSPDLSYKPGSVLKI